MWIIHEKMIMINEVIVKLIFSIKSNQVKKSKKSSAEVNKNTEYKKQLFQT